MPVHPSTAPILPMPMPMALLVAAPLGPLASAGHAHINPPIPPELPPISPPPHGPQRSPDPPPPEIGEPEPLEVPPPLREPPDTPAPIGLPCRAGRYALRQAVPTAGAPA